jgi:LIVCS family branched-chain amino acid:cation transporter
MNKNGLIISTGFALFSMFFGAGNLVFPIQLGQETAGNHIMAASGIMLTGVIVPFLGVFAMLLYGGSLTEFFGYFGRRGTFLFSLVGLGLLGPFGVVARCLTVSHGALALIFHSITLPLSSFLLCCIIFLLSINKNRIISLLGTILTPFLLISIATIAVFGLWNVEAPAAVQDASWPSLKNGIFQGYQTMDLLAGFFFSQFVITHLREKLGENGEQHLLASIFSRSLLIGVVLMSAVYLAMVMLGAYYAPMLADKPPQEMLGLIALASVGSLAAPIVCLAIIFACVTTAIVLSSLFAEFLKVEVCKNKFSHSTSLLITLIIGFGISTFDFNGIAKFLGPLIEMIYPALIVLTLYNIIAKGIALGRSRQVKED